MVREQIPLHASQKRISWSYEPVTRITDISCRAGAVLLDCTGMVVCTQEREGLRKLATRLKRNQTRRIHAHQRTVPPAPPVERSRCDCIPGPLASLAFRPKICREVIFALRISVLISRACSPPCKTNDSRPAQSLVSLVHTPYERTE